MATNTSKLDYLKKYMSKEDVKAETTNTSKLDYLKKYMSKEEFKAESKKKKKKKKTYGSNIKIFDSDIAISNLKGNEDDDEFALDEEKPLIYTEGGTILKKEYEEQKQIKESKWKSVNVAKSHIQRSQRHDSDSDSDISVPRGKQSPISQGKRTRQISKSSGSDSDMSVKRQRQRHDSSGSEDLSPPRRASRSNTPERDISPPRRKDNYDSDSDLSPARARDNLSDGDISPPRSKKRSKESSKRREIIPEVVSEGKKSGLQTGADLRKENELKKLKEREYFQNMDKSVSGKEAKTIIRDRKTGKQVDQKFEELQKRKREDEELKEKEKYARWGKGLKQEENYKEKLEFDLHEMEKPLARYKSDSDLDNLLKNADREGDPMLAYLSRKKTKEKKVSKPRYNGPTPPMNRFKIWPGYRYDGVDRSNGFEKRRFLEISNRKSLKHDAYKWSTEDM